MHSFCTRSQTAIAAMLASLLLSLPAPAKDFSVDPIRLELGPRMRSGVLTVRNDGKDRIGFQIEAMEWTQDATGADRYSETRDLIFYPKLLTLEGGEEGIVRVGVKTPLVQVEKTYRVFIQEMPEPEQTTPAGARVNLLLRFAAPVFVVPAEPVDAAELTGARLAKGVFALSARNTGNRHQMIQGIQLKGRDAQGSEVYATTLADRYLLAGAAKTYTATIPAEQCQRIAQLAVEFKTDKLTLTRKLDVNRAMCS